MRGARNAAWSGFLFLVLALRPAVSGASPQAPARMAPTIRVKFLFEGEEEGGSPHLAAFLDSHRELLKAGAMLLCDGPVHPSRRMQVVFGARGICDLEMTVYGPNRALHSGLYGHTLSPGLPGPVYRSAFPFG